MPVINSFASMKAWSFLQHMGDLAPAVALSSWALPAVTAGFVHWDTDVSSRSMPRSRRAFPSSSRDICSRPVGRFKKSMYTLKNTQAAVKVFTKSINPDIYSTPPEINGN